MMAHRFRARGMRPSLIVSSPAERAWETARLLARGIGYPLEFLQREPELYLAPPETVIAVLARQDSAFRDILLCAHNPGLTELARQITGTPIGDLPTCGAVIVEADVNAWCDFGTARLVLVDFPRGG